MEKRFFRSTNNGGQGEASGDEAAEPSAGFTEAEALEALDELARVAFRAEFERMRPRRFVSVPNTPVARVIVESENRCSYCGHPVCVLSDTVSFAANTRLFCDACGAPWVPA